MEEDAYVKTDWRWTANVLIPEYVASVTIHI
jgi:hypothetical protein